MKINKKSVKIVKKFLKNAPEKIKNTRETISDNVKYIGGEISAAYSKAAINIDNKANEVTLKAEEILKSEFLTNEYVISNSFISSKDNLIRFRIGKPIEGFKNLYGDDKRACCYFDNVGNITHVFMKDNKLGDVEIYNLIDNKRIRYEKEDIDALFYYKYHPESIHSKLRFGRDLFSGSMKEETDSVIKKLDEIFSDKSKLSVDSERKTLYRALQEHLSPEDVEKLKTVGAVFTEKSYCSTTTNLDTAKRFSCGNPIIEIDYPANEGFVELEKIFNIDRTHFNEQECFLKKGSSFEIKGFDEEKNVIRVKYL